MPRAICVNMRIVGTHYRQTRTLYAYIDIN